MSGLLADHQIVDRYEDAIRAGLPPLIDPFFNFQIKYFDGIGPVISYGLTSYGYDVRVANDFLIYNNLKQAIIDPKRMNPNCFTKASGKMGEPVTIPPNSFALCHTIEVIRVPRDCLVRITGKSTYARSAQITPVTPLEPEWEGQITVEISNTAPIPCMIYPEEGIFQIHFEVAEQVCQVSYADRGGKYQHQRGIVLPRV